MACGSEAPPALSRGAREVKVGDKFKWRQDLEDDGVQVFKTRGGELRELIQSQDDAALCRRPRRSGGSPSRLLHEVWSLSYDVRVARTVCEDYGVRGTAGELNKLVKQTLWKDHFAAIVPRHQFR
ncbi:hypothetical protein PR002_g13112 [Phytophthora rubi]|uniref:Uncharacterized protein n=1 Tax=Phytophthora rubi TaxID=129364 RepID=A0A6A3LG96_9STRA|nr:hypothetical protein PR002_g13112 [Phytophthora rubi]